MAFDYNASAETALSLLTNFGKSFAIARPVTDYNFVEGEATTPDPDTSLAGTITAVVLPAKASALNLLEAQSDDSFKEALLRGKARFVIAAAKGVSFVPQIGDLLTLRNETFKIVGMVDLAPAEISVIFKFGAVLV